MLIVFHKGDAPTLVRVNLYLRSISKIDDYNMVSWRDVCNSELSNCHFYSLQKYRHIFNHSGY